MCCLCLRNDVHAALRCLSTFFHCKSVSIPFVETLVQRLVDRLAVGRAMDFMAKSADKIIKARRMDMDSGTLVSF